MYRPALGVGVDFAETKTYRRCVTTPVTSNRHAFAARLYDELAVHDRSELNSALNIDASLSAKGMWGSAGGAASYFKNVQMSSDAFYWLMHADYKLLDEGIDTGDRSFSLTEEARRILQGPRGLAGFREACGEYFYSGSRLGAHYALLYEFKSSEQKTIERIRADASYSGWGVEAKASFEKFAQMAQKASVLKVYSSSEGGGDRLRSYATNPEQLEQELSILRDDLYNQGKGVETQWFMSDYNMFAEVQEAKARDEELGHTPPSSISKLLKDAALSRLYERFARNIDQQQQLLALLDRSEGSEPLYTYSPAKRAIIRQTLKQIDGNNIAIATRAKECLFGEQEACATTDLVDQVPWQDDNAGEVFTPDEDFTTLRGWTLMFSQNPESRHHLRFIGTPPDTNAEPVIFMSGFTIADSPIGVMARANEGQNFAKVIGSVELVRDPTHGQMRPNVCIYNYERVCTLRIVPLSANPENAIRRVKLQLVMFDDYGFVEKRLEFPAIN